MYTRKLDSHSATGSGGKIRTKSGLCCSAEILDWKDGTVLMDIGCRTENIGLAGHDLYRGQTKNCNEYIMK